MPQNRFRNNMASNAIVDVARRKFLNTSIVSDEQIGSVNQPVPLITFSSLASFS